MNAAARNALARIPLAVALALAATGTGAQHVPEAAIAAEQRQDWAGAAAIYRAELEQRPGDIALWRRLSDVEAAAGNAAAAAAALGEAAARVPGDAALQYAHSRALSVAGEPEAAMAAIDRAIAIDPDEAEYWVARAQVANWLKQNEVAAESLQRAEQLAGGRDDLADDIARTRAWRGDLKGGIAQMQDYLSRHPEDAAAQRDLVRFLTWRGDYPAAWDALEEYDQRFGADDESAALRARVLAWADRREQALQINDRLLASEPDDYDAIYTQALVLRQTPVPLQAMPWVERAEAIKPGVKETIDLARATDVATASKIGIGAELADDSLDIERQTLHAYGEWVLGERWRLLGQLAWRDHEAPIGSGFEPVTGGDSVEERRIGIGVRGGLSRRTQVEAWVGSSELDPGDATTIASVELDFAPSDPWRVSVGAQRDRVAASPRSLSLDLTHTGLYATAQYRPNLRWTFDGIVRADDYSDDNDRLAVDIAGRRAIVRSEKFNLDLGAAAHWEGFDHDPGNGYYAPDSYRRIQLTALGYWKFNDDAGLHATVAVGVQRDDTFDSWKSAHDAALELNLGIFKPWHFKAYAAYSDRRQAAGGFDATRVGVVLERRF